ncbi:HNH endonuclease signature motif containing protein [Tsukamurella tyrosinosolvens]|uniref:HNH endonuclease signature motif containing protein n=1 Tax=Tsukamurella tyrosinosolvens TaxID=57704 RepID=UPI000C7EBB64|nr:HNH endonuclease signature motif containing protein [Tsukamurella tyrosinosolvens]AUN41239.1 hypothetical protein ASU32_15555 [Tsukamurella tyrosinosolvens]
MAIPSALLDLPGDIIPQGLAAAGVDPCAVAQVLFEQRRSENRAFCRTMTTVYALHRVMYADDEAEYLAQPGDYVEAVQARRRLSAAAEALEAQASTAMRVGPSGAAHAIEVAVGLVERIPRILSLIGEGVISPKAGEVALTRSRVLSAEQVRVFDGRLAERLTRQYEVLALPALREAADLVVDQIDPEAVERRRRAAEQDRRVTFRPEEDGMAAAFALLPAQDTAELSTRVDYIAGTVCAEDPRTLPQRYADGLMQLTRGYSTLGCQCETAECRYREARYQGEPDADGVITRFITMINVVVNERDLADPADTTTDVAGGGSEAEGAGDASGFAYLVGHGPITGAHARELAARDDAKVRPFGRRIADSSETLAPDVGAEPSLTAVDDAGSTRATHDIAFTFAEIVARIEGHSGPWGGPAGDGPDDPEPDDPGPAGGSPPDGDRGPDTGPAGAPPPGGRRMDIGSSDVGGPGPSETTSRASRGGAVVRARGSAGYRPSADLRRYLRLLFPRCVFPFCNRPASRAQIDHRREYDHRAPELGGGTTADQIQPLCVAHHQLKTAGQWIDARLNDGRILWASPDGRRYIVDPHGVVLELFPDLARVEWIVPERAISPRAEASAGVRTRLQREHARRERLRRRNIATMEAERSRHCAPLSEFEDGLVAALGVPRPRRAPSFDGPPPY